jgi:hypothetical protein
MEVGDPADVPYDGLIVDMAVADEDVVSEAGDVYHERISVAPNLA